MALRVLVGMIGSGKSSYCKKMAKQGWLVINDDSIVNMLHADHYTLYQKSLHHYYKDISNFMIEEALKLGQNVIVDRTNLKLETRSRYIGMAKLAGTKVSAVIFPTEAPETHAHRRSNSDSRGHDYNYWLKVARFHASEFVEPTKQEGFDEIIYV